MADPLAIAPPTSSPFGTLSKPSFANPAPASTSLFSSPMQSSTPSSTAAQFTPYAAQGGVIGNLIAGNGGYPAGTFDGTAVQPIVKPTSTGGVTFPASVASGYSQPATANTNTDSSNTGLGQFLTNTQPTSGGGNITTTGGQPTGYTGNAGFQINTGGAIDSSALGSSLTSADLGQKYGSYSDYVNAVAAANGYSPQYIQALQGQYGAQATGAGLQANSANLNANLATGIGTTGLSSGQAQTFTGQEQALNTQQQSLNAIQQLSANQALNTAQLQRTGNIAAAQTELQYSPEGQAGSNAIAQYNSLQQAYPGASIPEYNQALTPEQNQQIASYIVANSPAYKSQFQSTYQTPGGGTGIYSKLDVGSGGFQQNSDGSYTLVPAAAAALGSANANVVQTQLGNLSNINSAINASQKTLQTTQQFMNQYGLNQSGVSILSQIQNSTNKQLNKAGAVAGLNADLNALRADYAQYLIGRGGSVAGTNQEAQDAIPDTISPAQLQTLVQQMQQDGQNAADAVAGQVNSALQGITNNSVPTSNNQTSGSSIYSF